MMELTPYSQLIEFETAKHPGNPPIHLWHPDKLGQVDIKITANGEWIHEGGIIKRQRLARLFASVLRLEADGQYYLVTPVEKCRIEVEDVPFMAILLEVSGSGSDQTLSFTTNMGETVVADPDHEIRFVFSETDEPSPYIMVRDGLEARLNRNVYYQLADLMVSEVIKGQSWLGVWSEGDFFKVLSND